MPVLLKVSSLSFPSPPIGMFGRDAPLVAEVGVGSGGFLEALAAGHPEWNVLGVERAPQSVARTYRRLRLSGLQNARVLKADAVFVVRNVIEPRGLAELYVNFPDPWPRRKHRDRRLLNADFLRLLASRLADGGKLLLTTDHPGYLEFVTANARETGLFETAEGDPPPEVFETKYARKWKSRDLDLHHAVFKRTGPPDAFDVDIEICTEMHHVVLEGELPDFEPFERKTFSFRGGVAVVLDVYREADGLVFPVHVEEAGLSQDILIEARRGKNGIVLGVKRFGEPLHTRGVGRAVGALAGWMEEKGMRVVHRKC